MAFPAPSPDHREEQPFQVASSARPTPSMTPVPRADRSRPLPENYFEGQRSGASIVKPGAFGVPTSNSPGTIGTSPSLTRRPTPTPRTTTVANPSANGGAQFWQDNAASYPRIVPSTRPVASPDPVAPSVAFTRPVPQGGITNPARRATGLTFDDVVRRMDMAANQAEWNAKKVGLTRSQRQAISAADQERIGFWRDQAASIPGAEARMQEYMAQQQGETDRNATTNRTQAGIAAGNNATDLANTQLQQQGETLRSTDRNAAELAAARLRRPQPQLITQEDGSIGFVSPDDGFRPTLDATGNPIRLQRPTPQIDQGALARLSSDLMPQFLGVDNYGQIADPEARGGRRAPTAEDRERAYRQATEAARQTLGGNPAASSQPTPTSRPQANAAPAGRSVPVSEAEFLDRVREANPDYTEAELRAYFAQTYRQR